VESTRNVNTVFVAVLLALSMNAVPLQAGRHDGDYLNKVTTKLVTPHTKWAKPYSRGKLKVLFVVPRTVAPREIVELWQRLDMDFDAVPIAHSGLFSFESDAGAAMYDLKVEGTSIEEKTQQLLTALDKRYDAFVMANASFDVLPKEAQYKILKQVSEGAGLLFTFGRLTRLQIFKKPMTEGRDEIFNGVPLAGIDFFRNPEILKNLRVKEAKELPARMVETFAFRQGRVAVLQYGQGSGTYYGGHGLTPPVPYSLHWAADYDYLLSLVAKALLWTVPSKSPRVMLTSLPEAGIHLNRAALSRENGVTVQYNEAQPLPVYVHVRIRDKVNEVEFYQVLKTSLKQGENFVRVGRPKLKAGGHFGDVIIKSSQGTEAWGSVYIEVESSLRIDQFGTQSEFCERGQVAKGNCELSVPAPTETVLEVSLTDTHDRVYLRKSIPIASGQQSASFDLPVEKALTIASRLHADLKVGAETVDSADRFLFVPRRDNSDEFRSILWGGIGCGNTGLGWLAYQQVRKAGFNAILAHPSADGVQERVFALNDFPLVCYAYRVMGGADDKGWRKDHWIKDVEDGCFYNPELQQKSSKSVLDRIQAAIPYGPSLYSLGDENYFDYKSGYSPYGQKSFREYLKQHYATLSELNRIWGTQYADWSKIDLLPDDEAKQRNLWPMIHEHAAFCESEYADYHHFLSKAIKGADARAKVGAEGSVPGDLEKTIKGQEIWGPYADKRGNELLRSLADPAVVRGNWWGGYVGSHGSRAGAFNLWNQLLHGDVNTSLFFAAIGSEGLFATDLSFAGYFEQSLPELREIYGGIGQLLAASVVDNDGIAIHWSQATEHSAKLFSGIGSPQQSQGNLISLLDHAGFGYRFITTRMIEHGELAKHAHKVLFLACSQTISDKEALVIRRFAEGGGTVIADIAAGIMDGHCRPLWKDGAWKGPLDDLFGIARSGEPKSKQIAESKSRAAGEEVNLPDFSPRVDTSVTVSGGKALRQADEYPVVIANKAGKGRTVFLNSPFPHADNPSSKGFISALFVGLKSRPPCELVGDRGYFFRRLRNGDLTLLGVVRDASVAADAKLQLADKTNIYDVRAGKLVGNADSIAVSKDGPQVCLFALLPDVTKKFGVSVPQKVQRGETANVTFKLDSGKCNPAGRIVRLTVTRPDKSEATAYRSYMKLTGNQDAAQIPTAYNDPPGKWTVTATDVATGTTGKGVFALQ